MDNHHKSEDSQPANSIKMDFSARLSRLMREKGLSQAELSRQSGEGATKISEYIKGKILPSGLTAIALSDALDTTVEYLLLGRQRTVATEYAVPVLDVRLSAGAGHASTHELVSSYMTLDGDILRSLNRTNTEGLSIVHAAGDSMHPEIRDGSPVLIDENDTRLREGFIYAFRLGDDLRIKRLRPFGLGGVEALSSNPLYPPETFEADILQHFAIIGRAVHAWNRL